MQAHLDKKPQGFQRHIIESNNACVKSNCLDFIFLEKTLTYFPCFLSAKVKFPSKEHLGTCLAIYGVNAFEDLVHLSQHAVSAEVPAVLNVATSKWWMGLGDVLATKRVQN